MKRARRPGQRAGLAPDDVLTAARELAATGGVAAVSMRSLAAALGVAPNALYSHFADKQAVLDALLDALLGEIPTPDAARGDWRGKLIALLDASRRVVLAHPELISQFLSRPGAGPNAQRLGAAMLALLARAGVTGRAAQDALQILLIYTLGFAAHEAPRRLRAPHAGGRHPDDATFRRGLGWLLDGIVAES